MAKCLTEILEVAGLSRVSLRESAAILLSKISSPWLLRCQHQLLV